LTKKLIILRHAKSGWDDPVARDFDRPLNARGDKAAQMMGVWMARNKVAPDHVIASPAVRVVETIDKLAAGFGTRIEVQWERRIYLASSATLMDVLREVDDQYQTVLIVGHNPGLEDLVLDMVPEGVDPERRALVEAKFPTAALAELTLSIDSWSAIDRNIARFDRFTRPRDLDPSMGPEED
jgi:phosphohistidine phosphatase